jgi:hypothetical protein
MSAPILSEVTPIAHHWLEIVSWIANGVLAIVGVIALSQVWAAIKTANTALAQTKILLEQVRVATDQLELSRKDIILRSRRESLSIALEQCKRFAESIVPNFDKLHREMVNQKKYLPPPVETDPNFPVIPAEMDPQGAKLWGTDHDLRMQIVNVLNELESFAMYFACDLADEQTAFVPTAQTFCSECEYLRWFIGVFRPKEGVKLYQNVVKLYGLWKPRLERTVLEEQSKLLDQKKKQLPADKPGNPLGTQPL